MKFSINGFLVLELIIETNFIDKKTVCSFFKTFARVMCKTCMCQKINKVEKVKIVTDETL